MAVYTIIILKDLSPVHMGTGKENYDFSASQLHSDTLSSALVAMKAKHSNCDNLEEFLHSFTVSSAFPYIGKQFFLPRPMGKMNIEIVDCDEYVSRKKLKSIKFVEQSLWKELIAGKQIKVLTSQLKNGFLLSSVEDFKQPYQSVVNQRVTIPREEGKDAEPFFFDWTFFDKEAGLYCMTDASGDKLEEILKWFTLLGEYGIGTDKNIGGGKFTICTQTIEIPDVEDANACMLLSLYIPEENEFRNSIDLDNSRYELCLRGGFMAGSQENDFWHLRKKSIYMFNVGSILKCSDKLKGKVVDLRPTDYNDSRMHPVYRSGKPFVIPIKI